MDAALKNCLIIASLLTFFALNEARAQVTYSFTGQPFSTVQAPYSSGDRVSGSITLPLPLPGSVSGLDLAGVLMGYEFNDGVQLRNRSNSSLCTLTVSTDANGNISAWTVNLREPFPGTGNPQQFMDISDSGDQVGEGPAGGNACDTIAPSILSSVNAAGQWTGGGVSGSNIRYSYAGPNFTIFDPPYTGSDQLSGYLDFGAPLPPHMPFTNLADFVLDLSFVDGVQTRSIANSERCNVLLATDGSGNIVSWALTLRQIPLPNPGDPQQSVDTNSSFDLVGEAPASTDVCGLLSLSPLAQTSAPGQWSSSLPPAVPTTYNYTGDPFTSANPPWQVGDNITGSLTLAGPLPANRPLADIAPGVLDFEFEDGVQSRTPGNSAICFLQVGTNAAGEIVDWLVSLRETPLPPMGMDQQFLDSTSVDDLVGVGPAGFSECDEFSGTSIGESLTPGTWTRQGALAIPALTPGGLAMLVMLLLAVASFAVRRARG